MKKRTSGGARTDLKGKSQEERRKKYVEVTKRSITKKRNEYSRILKLEREGDISELQKRRMYPLYSILKARKVSYANLGRMTGYHTQQIQWWFIGDDIRHSILDEILDCIGMEAEFSFKGNIKEGAEMPFKIEDFENDKIAFQVQSSGTSAMDQPVWSMNKPMRIILELQRINTGVTRIEDSEVFKKGEPCGHPRMNFLYETILNFKGCFTRFCASVKLHPVTVMKWLKEGDIRLSKYYTMADKLGLQLVWSVRMKSKQ